jgi:hypothetical protein
MSDKGQDWFSGVLAVVAGATSDGRVSFVKESEHHATHPNGFSCSAHFKNGTCWSVAADTPIEALLALVEKYDPETKAQ